MLKIKPVPAILSNKETGEWMFAMDDTDFYDFIILSLVASFNNQEGMCLELGGFRITYDDYEDECCFFTKNSDDLLYKIESKGPPFYICQKALNDLLKQSIKNPQFLNYFGKDAGSLVKKINAKIKDTKQGSWLYRVVNNSIDIQHVNLLILKDYIKGSKHKSKNAYIYLQRIMNNDVQLLPRKLRNQCINVRDDFHYFDERVLQAENSITILRNSKEYAERYYNKDFYISYVSDLNHHITSHPIRPWKEHVYGVLELDRNDDEYDVFSLPFCSGCIDSVLNNLSKICAENPIYINRRTQCRFIYFSSFPEGNHCYFSGSDKGPCYDLQIGYVTFLASEYWVKKLISALEEMKEEMNRRMIGKYDKEYMKGVE